MGQHRDDSKAGFPEGRTGYDEHGAHSVVSQPDRKPRGHGLSPVPPPNERRPGEEQTFSHGGAVGSQPGLGKRLATDEEQDAGHLDRADLRKNEPGSGENNRARGAAKHRPQGG